MSKILFAFLFVFSQFFANGQSPIDSIYGHWKEYKLTLKDGETGRNVTFTGKDYTPSWDLIFEKTGICRDLENDLTYSYSVSNGLLFLGDRQYKMTELTEKTLVLTEHDPDDPDDPLGFIHYLERVN